nr:hypothetical protein Iba_chr14aCG6220 [Ipomoea batatas]
MMFKFLRHVHFMVFKLQWRMYILRCTAYFWRPTLRIPVRKANCLMQLKPFPALQKRPSGL